MKDKSIRGETSGKREELIVLNHGAREEIESLERGGKVAKMMEGGA